MWNLIQQVLLIRKKISVLFARLVKITNNFAQNRILSDMILMSHLLCTISLFSEIQVRRDARRRNLVDERRHRDDYGEESRRMVARRMWPGQSRMVPFQLRARTLRHAFKHAATSAE